MELVLERHQINPLFTGGMLTVDGVFNCFTLEDPEREVKIPNETCIPVGRYEIMITYSPRFKQMMPLLKYVPGFTGIRIHPGNTAGDTRGCILVGRILEDGRLKESRKAYAPLLVKIREGLKHGGKAWIEVTHGT